MAILQPSKKIVLRSLLVTSGFTAFFSVSFSPEVFNRESFLNGFVSYFFTKFPRYRSLKTETLFFDQREKTA
jgi:hypothetical protein